MFISCCLPLAAAVIALALLAGCASDNPYDIQNQSQGGMSKAAKYGGPGALAGAIADAAIDHNNRGKGVLTSAAVTGAAAASYGHCADKQEVELRRRMEGIGVEVQRQDGDIKLVMPGNIAFVTDSANIASSFYASLNSLASSLKQYNQNTIETVGYTDSAGSRQHDMGLFQRRAQSVIGYLTAQGADDTRLSARDVGLNQSIAGNPTTDSCTQSQCVEVNLQPVPDTQGPAQIQPQY